MISCIAALGTFYPEANPALAGEDVFEDTRLQTKQIYRILGKMPTLAANAYRHRMGRPFNTPNQVRAVAGVGGWVCRGFVDCCCWLSSVATFFLGKGELLRWGVVVETCGVADAF